jgi:hypothetical protein
LNYFASSSPPLKKKLAGTCSNSYQLDE